MHFFPELFSRVSMRVTQGLAVALAVIAVTLIALIALASYTLAHMQQELAPLVTRELKQALGRDVRIGSVDVRGWDSVVLTDTTIAKGSSFATGTAFRAPQITARVNLLSLALHRGKDPIGSISQVIVRQPVVAVARSQEGQWDFQDIIDRVNAKKSTGTLHAQVIMKHGNVAYNDAHGFGENTEPIHQQLVDVSGRLTPMGMQNYQFDVAANDAADKMGRIKVGGAYSARAGATNLTVRANDVAVEEVTRFLPEQIPITFENGTAAFRLSALFRNLPAPRTGEKIPTTELTAEVDLSGVGLRLDELSAPIIAKSGRLRLVHDQQRYPKGSRLELIGVRAQVGEVPIDLQGTISELDLRDLSHINPRFDVSLATSTRDGASLISLFPEATWLRELHLDGPVSLKANATGPQDDLRIRGEILGDRMQVADLSGKGLRAEFSLRPQADAAKNQPSVEMTVDLQQASWEESTFSGLQLAGTSLTPWRDLEDRLQVSGSMKGKQVTFPWGEATGIDGNFTLTPDQLTLQDVSAKLFGGAVAGDITIPIFARAEEGDALRATARYQGIQLAQFARQLGFAALSGSGDGSLTLAITPQGRITIASELTASDIHYQRYAAPTATVSLRTLTQDGLTTVDIPTAHAQTNYGSFTVTDGRVQRGDAQANNGGLHLPFVADNIPLQQFSDDFRGNASLRGILTGSLTSPNLTASVTTQNGSVFGRAYQHGQGELTMANGDLRFRNVVFSRPGMVVRVDGGENGFDPRNGFQNIPLTLQIDGAPVQDVLDVVKLESPWKIDGKTQGNLDIRMTDHGVTANGSVAVPNAIVHIPTHAGDYPLNLDKLGAEFSYADRKVVIDRLTALTGETMLEIDGTASAPTDGPVSVDLAFRTPRALLEELPQDLFGIPVSLSGPADLTGTLNGELNGRGAEPLQLKLDMNSPQLTAEGLPLGNGAVKLSYRYRPQDRELVIHQGTIENPAFRAITSGQYRLNARQMNDARLTLERVDLAALQSFLANADASGKGAIIAEAIRQSFPEPIKGHGRIAVTADGNFSKPAATLGMTLSEIAIGNKPVPNLRAELATEFVNGRYALRVKEVVAEGGNGQGSARLNGSVTPDGDLDLQYAAQDITTGLLTPWIGALPVDGVFSATGTVHGPWKAPDISGDAQVDHPVVAGVRLHRASAKMQLSGDRLAVSNGALWVQPASQPLSFAGTVPVQRDGLQISFPRDRQLSLSAEIPKQDLAIIRALIPGMPEAEGVIEGHVRVAGTVYAPRLDEGRFQLAGSASLPTMDGAYPNRVENIDLLVNVTSDGGRSKIAVERLTAMLDRQEKGSRPRDFQPGWISSEGSVTIGTADLQNLDRWQWDLYAKVIDLPLAHELFLVPRVSGFLHIENEQGRPLVKGVMLAENARIKEPKLTTSEKKWGPFSFDPKLSIVLQVGERVKLAKSIVRLPLKVTPLPWPQEKSTAAGVSPSLVIDRSDAAYDYNASMLNPNSSAELPGTWGVVTGSLENPQLYARFEVDKKRLSFPFTLIGSVRTAKGHITFSLADGPHITMGIPDFPQAPPAAQAPAATQAKVAPAPAKEVSAPPVSADTTGAASPSVAPDVAPAPAQ